jgi:predicted nucleotidyltransferase
MTKMYILNFLKEHRDEMKERFGLIRIGLFGSYAKDTADEESDIDLYAEFEDKTFKNIAGVWNYLEEQFGKKVDLFYAHKNMRDSLKANIENEVIYG